jgi:hypothetical protein
MRSGGRTEQPCQRLELVIRQLLRAQFGRKSERLDSEQFQLTLGNLEQEIAAAKATSFHTNAVDLIEGCSRDHKIPQTL